jgi:spermidine/putrescine transport system permease protein
VVGNEIELFLFQGSRQSAAASLVLLLSMILMVTVVASVLIVFASSMDDFVISAFLSKGGSTATVPIRLYSAVRNAPSPALNALATVLLVGSALAGRLAVARARPRAPS